MDDLFSAARLKIEGAKKHISNLDEAIKSFVQRNNHVVFIEDNLQTKEQILKAGAIEPLPDNCGLLVGDALHNLRTALDYVASDIEFLYTGQRTNFTKFPICGDRERFEAAINGGFKEKVPPQVIGCLEDIVQPYAGGNCGDLWALHAIDIQDKHLFPITLLEESFVSGICIENESGMETEIGTWKIHKLVVFGHRLPPGQHFHIKNQGNATYSVTFEQGPPFNQAKVISALYRLTELTSWAIREITRSYILSTM